MTASVDALHDRVIVGLAHNPRGFGEEYLKEVALTVVPNFYMLGDECQDIVQ